MHVFRCTSREGGYLYSRISRHFMALEVLENRISGNNNFLLTIRLLLMTLCCHSVNTDWLVLCVVTLIGRHEGLLKLLSSLFAVRLSSFLTSTCTSLIRRRGSKLFRVSVILGRTDLWLRSRFPFLPRFSSTWAQHSLDFGSLFSTSLFSCVMMVNASLRESFSCSNDKAWLSKVKHFASNSLIALSFFSNRGVQLVQEAFSS